MANYNPNRVKINRNYTYEELAAVFGVHKNTVATWVKKGLQCLNERRPFLILGSDARAYLQKRRAVKKQTCKQSELYCLRCKAPTVPAENFVEYSILSASKGRLNGFCGRCECEVNKFISLASLPVYVHVFEVSMPKALEHIRGCDSPL